MNRHLRPLRPFGGFFFLVYAGIIAAIVFPVALILELSSRRMPLQSLDAEQAAAHADASQSGSEALLLGHSALHGVGLLGTRIDPAPMPESWRARLGAFAVAPGAPRELLDQAVLSEVGGLLVLTYTGPLYGGAPVTMALDPTAGDLAAVAGLGRHRGDVVRFEQTSDGAWLHLKGVRLARVPTASAGHDF
ncbi:hypothetical protein NVS55_10715 [Myxococcus stipitatus]|uniref:hypothetical protein n=1 Tax=Myxococcus stipitatus TaxID=83455 RepID=UPI003144E113